MLMAVSLLPSLGQSNVVSSGPRLSSRLPRRVASPQARAHALSSSSVAARSRPSALPRLGGGGLIGAPPKPLPHDAAATATSKERSIGAIAENCLRVLIVAPLTLRQTSVDNYLSDLLKALQGNDAIEVSVYHPDTARLFDIFTDVRVRCVTVVCSFSPS